MVVGGVLGQVASVALAVAGGRALAKRIDPGTVNMVGGASFILFSATAVLFE